MKSRKKSGFGYLVRLIFESISIIRAIIEAARRWPLFLQGGYGVETTGVPGVTAQDPPRAEPQATHTTMPLHGLQGIGGTGWIKTAAGWKKRAYRILIQPNQKLYDESHRLRIFFQWRSRERKKSVVSTPSIAVRAMITTSSPRSCR